MRSVGPNSSQAERLPTSTRRSSRPSSTYRPSQPGSARATIAWVSQLGARAPSPSRWHGPGPRRPRRGEPPRRGRGRRRGGPPYGGDQAGSAPLKRTPGVTRVSAGEQPLVRRMTHGVGTRPGMGYSLDRASQGVCKCLTMTSPSAARRARREPDRRPHPGPLGQHPRTRSPTPPQPSAGTVENPLRTPPGDAPPAPSTIRCRTPPGDAPPAPSRIALYDPTDAHQTPTRSH